MNGRFYSVEEISSILDIHPKTVQRYIREGKIKATKVGKAWRVMEKDFKVFMNVTDSDSNLTRVEKSLEPQNTYDFIKVSSVVDISVKSTEDAIKIANILTASLNGQHETHGKSSLNIQFIEPENKVRVMLWGNIKFMETMMSFMSDYLENYVG